MTDVSDPLALAQRTGLPDALRVLAAQYPRADWEGHGNFTALTRFWLDRHLMFRKALGELRGLGTDLTEGRDVDRARGRLARLGQFTLQELHGHHTIEDTHYFPVLARQDARLVRGFEMLDHDHHAIDGVLAGFADAANGVLGAEGELTRAADRLATELERFDRFLDRHLEDEEELVVPVLLAYAPAEFER